jgi:hypothetical protein
MQKRRWQARALGFDRAYAAPQSCVLVCYLSLHWALLFSLSGIDWLRLM